MPTVTVKEVFDLHTTPNKITLIGVHTPSSQLLAVNYPHLHVACKKMRFVSCNVAIACASVLPVDPLQVGTQSGDVAPEDLFNPILYRAVTRESFNALDARMNTLADSTADVNGSTASVDVDNVTSTTDQFGVYYGLLGDHHGFKTASPQQGLTMTDLRPLVYETYQDVGYVGQTANVADPQYPVYTNDGKVSFQSPSGFRGSAHAMPALDTLAPTLDNNNVPLEDDVPAWDDSGNIKLQTILTRIPKYAPIYVAAIVMPPARLHQFYYRMVVSWSVEYSGLRTPSDLTSLSYMSGVGGVTHHALPGTVPAAAKVALPVIAAEDAEVDNQTATVDLDTVSASPSANISKVI